MTRKQTVIIIVLAVVVLGGLIVGVFVRNGEIPAGPAGSVSGGNFSTSTLPAGSVVSGTTVLYNPTVPQNATASIPVQSAPAAPNVSEQLGIFNMTVSASGFSPVTLTVHQGDLVQIRVTAVGADYDIVIPYMGLSATVAKGETKQISFGATSSGTFGFSCDKKCPAGGKISGEIIVLPK
jgi:heme/copper-type cytochrome/quinol oxidase subunit 2